MGVCPDCDARCHVSPTDHTSQKYDITVSEMSNSWPVSYISIAIYIYVYVCVYIYIYIYIYTYRMA